MDLDEEAKLAEYLFKLPPDFSEKVQKKVHKKIVQSATGKDKTPVVRD